MTKIQQVAYSIIACAISLLFVFFIPNSNRYYGAQTIYRVYLNGVSIGLIKDKQELENYIDQEQKAIKNKYNVSKVYVPKGLEIKQELTYSNQLESTIDIYNKIKDIEPFTIDGYVVTITGEEKLGYTEDEENEEDVEAKQILTTIYVLNRKIFDDAINSTVTVFVDEDKYEDYQKEMQSEIDSLEIGEYIENVYIKEQVKIKQDYISVDNNIFTDSKELTKYLLYGTLDEQKVYTVKFGDTIAEIANKNQLNVREFLIVNKDLAGENTLLYAGQQVSVGIINPIVTIVEETTEALYQEKEYKTEVVEDSSFYVGYSRIIQKGIKGEEYITKNVKKENGKITEAINISSIVTKEPVNRIVKTGSRTQFAIGNTGIWVWPTRSGGSISTYFGHDNSMGYYRYHEAIDITGTGCNSPIYAANDGTVTTAKYQASLGNYIAINHNNGYVTLYAHLNRMYVSVGQAVSMGDVIGLMGSTGFSTGCHLHFVTSYNGVKFNPFQLYE